MIFKPFSPFPLDPSRINVDGSNWAGNFSSNIVPESSLSPLVPGSNILAARASSLKGGFRKNKSKKNNMRLYNKMRHTHKKYTKGCKKCIRKRKSRRVRSRSMKGGINARARGGMRGGNDPIRNWITGNSLNNSSFRTPINLPPALSALANPVPFFSTSHNL